MALLTCPLYWWAVLWLTLFLKQGSDMSLPDATERQDLGTSVGIGEDATDERPAAAAGDLRLLPPDRSGRIHLRPPRRQRRQAREPPAQWRAHHHRHARPHPHLHGGEPRRHGGPPRPDPARSGRAAGLDAARDAGAATRRQAGRARSSAQLPFLR